MSNNLALALQLAARGWYIHPCKQNKTPYTKWENGATTDQAIIRNWWARWPNALIGIYCEKSGFFAVDLDRKPGAPDGVQAWAELVETHGAGIDIPTGPIQQTQTGGYHVLFTLPQDLKIPNNAGKLAPGIDLRSAGYICTGGPYTWLDNHGPETEPTPAPAWLLDLIRKMNERPQAHELQPQPAGVTSGSDPGTYWLDYYLQRAAPGCRNQTGFELACQLRDSGLPEIDAAPIMETYAARVPGADYSEREALASLQSAYQAPRREAAHLPGLTSRRNGHGPTPTPPDEFEGWPEETEPFETMQDKQFMLIESADHEGHARCVLANNPGAYSYSDRLGWLAYNGKFYTRENAELQVERAIVDTLRARRLLAVNANMEHLVKATSGNRFNIVGTREQLKSLVAVSVDDFDNNPDELNVNNGVLNLRSGQLTPHNRKQKFTYCIPVDYDLKADPGAFIAFLEQAVNNDHEIIDFIQLALGYTLTGYTWEEILLYLYGPTRSGKGTFTETLIKLMGGKPLATEVDFQTFSAPREGDTQNFDLAPLKPCRFVAASESNKHYPLNPAKVKQLTGGNYVYCAYKHREHFSYRPQYKIWLSSNHPVNIDVDDDAAWARVKVIDFPNSYLGHEDKTLKARLSNPENLRGLLFWIVEGAKKWYLLEGGLKPPKSITRATQSQRAAQDYVQQFIDELCEPAPDYWIHSGALHQSYKKWCEANGVPAKLQNQFSQSLTGKGYKLARRRADGKLFRVIEGLKIRCDA